MHTRARSTCNAVFYVQLVLGLKQPGGMRNLQHVRHDHATCDSVSLDSCSSGVCISIHKLCNAVEFAYALLVLSQRCVHKGALYTFTVQMTWTQFLPCEVE